MEKAPTRRQRSPRDTARQPRPLDLHDHELRRTLGLDRLFPIADRRPGAQAIAFLEHVGRADLADQVRSLMAEAQRAVKWHERWLGAIRAARSETETVKKLKAFASVLALDENPRAFDGGPADLDQENLFDLYVGGLQGQFDAELKPEWKDQPKDVRALLWLTQILGSKGTSSVRRKLHAERTRRGLTGDDVPIPGLNRRADGTLY